MEYVVFAVLMKNVWDRNLIKVLWYPETSETMIQQKTNPTSRCAKTFIRDAENVDAFLNFSPNITKAKISQQEIHNAVLVFCGNDNMLNWEPFKNSSSHLLFQLRVFLHFFQELLLWVIPSLQKIPLFYSTVNTLQSRKYLQYGPILVQGAI